jgi:hypothetical protein
MRDRIQALLASPLLALFFAFVVSALAAGGVISMTAVRIFLILAWCVGAGGVIFSRAMRCPHFRRIAGVVTVLLLAVALWGLDRWIERTGFLFLSPAFFPGSQTSLQVVARGKELFDNVEIRITDQDRGRALKNNATVSPEELAASHRELAYSEISAHPLPTPIFWPRLNPHSLRLDIAIKSRTHSFGEHIEAADCSGQWAAAIHVWESESGRSLILCRDAAFPVSPEYADARSECH